MPCGRPGDGGWCLWTYGGEPVFNTPEHQNLYAEVMALPVKYRLPLYLYYYEGYTAAEVGELLGLRPSTVRTRLARAREKLKAQLREE